MARAGVRWVEEGGAGGEDSGRSGGPPSGSLADWGTRLHSSGSSGWGGGGNNSSVGGVPPGFEFGPPVYDDTDKGIALFRLAVAVISFVLGILALVHFYRSRWILDIRTRSVRLVILEGTSVVLSLLVTINASVNIVWDAGLRWFWSSLLLFFLTPALYGSYICRALRLAVVFHPRAKRALPWLIPERNHVGFLLMLSLAMLSIPIYHEYSLPAWKIIPKQTDVLLQLTITFAAILVCLYPFIRKVDDLFNISTELIIVTVALVILGVAQELTQEHGGVIARRWISPNAPLLFVSFVFGVSVVDPLRRLALDPLAASKRNYEDRVLLNRREARKKTSGTSQTASSGISSGVGGDSEDEEAAARLEKGTATRAPYGGGSGVGYYSDGIAAAPTPTGSLAVVAASGTGHRRGGGGMVEDLEAESWDFERLATTPLLAAAFEEFSRKALCHESVLFLSEVSRYQSGDFSTPTGTSSQPSQFNSFSYITNTFIKAGSREEVNISDSDRKRILSWYHKGEATFEEEDEEERRMVFEDAYVEVRDMLEANLLRRFLQTDQFESVRSQREKITMMMVSPPT